MMERAVIAPAPLASQPGLQLGTLHSPISPPLSPTLSQEDQAQGQGLATSKDSVVPARPALEDLVWRHALDRGFEPAGRPDSALPRELEGTSAPSLAPSLAPAPEPVSSLASAAPAAAPLAEKARNIRRTSLGILGSVTAAELWLETGAFVVPFLSQSLSGSFLSTAVLCAGSVMALALGSVLGGPAVDRFGIRKVYVTGLLVRSIGAAVMGGLYAAGALSLPVLGALFAADYLLTGANRVAEASSATALHGSDIAGVNRFGAWKQRLIEIVGVAGPFLIGSTISVGGFGPALAIFGGVLGLGALLALAAVRPPSAAPASKTGSVREALSELAGKPALRWAAGLFGLATALNLWIYLMLGPAWSLATAPTPQAAAGVMGWMTGLFCVGGFVGTWLSERLTRDFSAGPDSRASFIRSTQRWAGFFAASLLGAWAFCLPGSLPALLAIVPFGVAFGGLLVQSETLIKLEAPERLRGTILGLAAAIGFAAAAAGFFPLGWLFDHFSVMAGGAARPAAAAFQVMGGLATSLSAASWWLAGRAPVVQPQAAPRIATLAALSRSRPAAGILKEIEGIIREKSWERWHPDIMTSISHPNSEVFLALDDRGSVAGFQIIADRYIDDTRRAEVVLPGPFYAAYIATRADAPVKGAGKALFLAGARFVRASGSGEMLAHIKKGSPAWGFFQSMARFVPIKSSVEDTSYVTGETWMYTTFDVSRISEDAP
jgi:MFS family permease